MNESMFPKLHFAYPYDERMASEAKSRGHLGGITVELADGSMHPVFFFDLTRLVQELEDDVKRGRPFIAERGMIVIPEITMENMLTAVQGLVKESFFEVTIS